MERLASVKGAIFDLDGTLLDSLSLWEEIDVQFLKKRGINIPVDYANTVKEMEFIEAAEYTVNRFGLNESPQSLIKEWKEEAKRAYAENIKLKPYAKEYLESLLKKGIKLAVATSLQNEVFVPALKNNGIYNMFSAFATTEEVAVGKANPDVYVTASKKMGLMPFECAVYEDLLIGIQSAKKAGFLTVGVFDAVSNCNEAIKKAADIYLMSFKIEN